MPKRLSLPCEELQRLYNDEGWTTVALSRRYGCSITTIANQLRRCGAELRDGRFQVRTIPHDELLRLYMDEGLSVRHIARHFDVSVSTIYNRLAATGTTKQRPRRVREQPSVHYKLRLGSACIDGVHIG